MLKTPVRLFRDLAWGCEVGDALRRRGGTRRGAAWRPDPARPAARPAPRRSAGACFRLRPPSALKFCPGEGFGEFGAVLGQRLRAMLGRLAVTGRVCVVGPDPAAQHAQGANFGPLARGTAAPAGSRWVVTLGPPRRSRPVSAPPRRRFGAGRGLPRHGWASLVRRGHERPARVDDRRLA